jgi:hypothetical protein
VCCLSKYFRMAQIMSTWEVDRNTLAWRLLSTFWPSTAPCSGASAAHDFERQTWPVFRRAAVICSCTSAMHSTVLESSSVGFPSTI